MHMFALFTSVNIEKNGYFCSLVHLSFVSTFFHMKPSQQGFTMRVSLKEHKLVYVSSK